MKSKKKKIKDLSTDDKLVILFGIPMVISWVFFVIMLVITAINPNEINIRLVVLFALLGVIFSRLIPEKQN